MTEQQMADAGYQQDSSGNYVGIGGLGYGQSAGSSSSAPTPPAGSYIINPGSVWQTYNPATGQTTYGGAPGGFASGVAPGIAAPAVVTPENTPSAGMVYQNEKFGYVPVSPFTRFKESTDAAGNTTIGSDFLANPSAGPFGGPITPASVSAGAPTVASNIPFKAGLSAEQRKSIEDLMRARPVGSWNETDKKNWAYATGGAPLPLGTTKAPTSAAGVNVLGGLSLPNNYPSLGDITGAMGAITGINTGLDTADQLFQQRLAQQQALLAQKQAANKPLLDRLLGAKGPAEAMADAWEQTGMDPRAYFADQKARIAEIQALNLDYNSTLAAKEAQVAKTNDMMGSMNFINNQIAQINRNAAPVLNMKAANINAKTATLEALQGNFASAQNFVNQAVDNATAEYKFRYDQYKLFAEINQEAFDSLDGVYKDAYNFALDKAKTDYDNAVADKREVGDLMLKYPTAGISMTDSYQSAMVKAQKVAAVEYNRKATGSGGGGSGLTSEEKEFQKDLTEGLKTLANDKNQWGSVWNYMKSRYNVPTETLDSLLNRDMFYPGDSSGSSNAGQKIEGIGQKIKNAWNYFWSK